MKMTYLAILNIGMNVGSLLFAFNVFMPFE